MSAQPIDPRALKAAEEIGQLTEAALVALNGPRLVFGEYHDQLARIIQSHFAESVNGGLLGALKEYLSRCSECGGSGVGRHTNGDPYQCQWCDSGLIAISLAQSQPPSMADELAEALREIINHTKLQMKHVDLLARHDAQKGQS